ncbi:interferon-induced protein 44-like [Colossoma macropomum]|uniref:interferon-induced protein 44-like n=1 Tax=Colossoma macropomum TaxID=42526 RepID=UPI0018651087|nr:interferon-induced protein 44-like [Colossoma macropomum]
MDPGLLIFSFCFTETKMGGTSSKSNPELINPWRPVNWSEKEKILKDLEDLKPQLEPLRILLYGPVGAGKSCFINSVQRALIGCNSICALESTTKSGESFTTTIKTHKLKKRGGGYYPVVFTDIMGLEMNRGGIHTEDIIKVLEGHMLDNYRVSTQS